MDGYIYFAVSLLLLTGILLITVDVKRFMRTKMNRERKTSLILGWINICFGLILFSVNWAYYQWFW